MFTQAELDEALAKIVRTSIRRPYGTLGNRELNTTYNDTKDAAAGAFILFPNAVYYVALLATQRLQQVLTNTLETLDDFVACARATSRRVSPVKNLNPLSNARVALDDLSSALESRSTAFRDIEDIPAYQRFNKNTQRFLNENGSNIRVNGSLVRTPAEAKVRLGVLSRDLKALHDEIVRRSDNLANAVENFSALNLPGLLSHSVISNARTVLRERVAELEGLTSDQRLEALRGVTLDVLAARAAVRGFGNLNAPTTFLDIDGDGQVYADESHLTSPATLTSLHAPFRVVPYLNDGGDVLDFITEGDALSISMLGSFVAKLEGTVKEPYDIGNPNTFGVNTKDLTVGLKNYPTVGAISTYAISLGGDVTKSAREMCDEVNAIIPSVVPLIAEPYANPLRFMGSVDIDTTAVPNDVRFTSTNPLTNFATLNVSVGDRLIVRGNGAHYGRVYEVVVVGTTTLDCDSVDVAPIVADETNKLIEIASGKLAVRFRITNVDDTPRPEYRLTALEDRVAIFFPSIPGSDDQLNGVSTYGFLPLMETVSKPTSANDIVRAFKLNAGTSLGGMPRLDAEVSFDPYLYEGAGRTEPDDISRVVLSKFRGSGAVTSGATPTFTIAGALEAGALIGDTLVVRGHPTTSQIGNEGIIIAVSDTSITAAMESSVIADSVDIEIGPSLTLPFDTVLQIQGGTPNDGEYTVLSSNGIDLTVFPSLSITNGVGRSTIPLTVALGLQRVVFKTTDTTLSSELEIVDVSTSSVISEFFPAPISSVGTTTFFQLPEIPKNLEVGDVLELYASQFDEPSTASAIIGFETDLRVIELETPLPTNTPAFSFVEGVVPFARIRKQRLENFSVLRTALQSSLDEPWMQKRSLLELDRLLNVLAGNPTSSQVGAVVSQLQLFIDGVSDLREALGTYEADVVPIVDALIETFREKGSERAIDLLLEARFSDFFGLSQEQLSYAGALRGAIRNVQKNDLPIRRMDRQGRARAALSTIATYEDTDFEFNKSDIDTRIEPDIPGAQGVPFPGQSF